jgi:hypothetical protein
VNFDLANPTVKEGLDRSLDLWSSSHHYFRFQRFSRNNMRLFHRANSELIDPMVKVGPYRFIDPRSRLFCVFKFWKTWSCYHANLPMYELMKTEVVEVVTPALLLQI